MKAVMNGSSFIKQHPVLAYYVLTFAISWGGILMVVSRGGVPGNPAQLQKMIPIMIVAMLAGPTVACILLTGMVCGRAGYRDLLTRLRTWRVGSGWYAVALLTAPLVLMAVPLALSLRSPDFLPRIFTDSNKGPILLMGFAAGSAAGVFEELGWTGFVLPKLRRFMSSSGMVETPRLQAK
jgi:membrane protease YdiL (CAAX protease family)